METLAPNSPLETSKHRQLVEKYCVGDGLDLGPFTDPINDRAVRVDRSKEFCHLCGDVRDLRWFRDGQFDYVHASHVLEDFADWGAVLSEWSRVLRVGGNLVISVPDRERFRERVRLGQPDNLDHKHESFLGEVETFLPGWPVELSQFVGEGDYSIVVVLKKPAVAATAGGAWWEESRKTIKAAHSGDLGDAIYAAAALRELCRQRNCQADITFYRAPGVREPFDLERAYNLGRLFADQKYIRRYRFVDRPLEAGDVQYDFAGWRKEYVASGGTANLGVSQCEWAGVDPAVLDKPWMEAVPMPIVLADQFGARPRPVVVCRSARYRHPTFPWGELAERYATRAICVGTPAEFSELHHMYGWGNYIKTPSLSELASIIAGAELVITNQTCVRAIAEALKKPVVMERCDWVPNVDFERPDVWAGEDRVREFMEGPDPVSPENATPPTSRQPAIRGVTTAA